MYKRRLARGRRCALKGLRLLNVLIVWQSKRETRLIEVLLLARCVGMLVLMR
jgi:hypothetical protein